MAVSMINQAKTKYYNETLAAANTKGMFQIVTNLISHQGKVLPSGDSDLALADKFADFFEHKVAGIRAELESVNTKPPPPHQHREQLAGWQSLMRLQMLL